MGPRLSKLRKLLVPKFSESASRSHAITFQKFNGSLKSAYLVSLDLDRFQNDDEILWTEVLCGNDCITNLYNAYLTNLYNGRICQVTTIVTVHLPNKQINIILSTVSLYLCIHELT